MWRGHGANGFLVTRLVAVTQEAGLGECSSEGRRGRAETGPIYIPNIYSFY